MVKRIAVCGLGYVGLPVAVAFSRRFDVIGFDVDKRRIARLKEGDDWTGEIERDVLLASSLQFTDQLLELQECDRDRFRYMDVLILAVPHGETMDSIWEDLPQLVKTGGMVCDLKSVLDTKRLPADLLYWTL